MSEPYVICAVGAEGRLVLVLDLFYKNLDSAEIEVARLNRRFDPMLGLPRYEVRKLVGVA